MKVVIDSNLLISSLLGKITARLINDLVLKKIELITSEKQIQEIIGVLKRPKFNNKISATQIIEMEELIRTHGFIA